MTPTMVLVLTYFGVAISSVLGAALMRFPRLLSSLLCRFTKESQGRHRRHRTAVLVEVRSA